MLFSLFSNEIFLVKIKYDFLYLYEFFNRNYFCIFMNGINILEMMNEFIV